MTVEIIAVERQKPIIKAFQIPEFCTMQDATDIESEFIDYIDYIKRLDWSAKDDRVFVFSINGIRVLPGAWVVITTDPNADIYRKFEFMGDVLFNERYVKTPQE